ncbi:MAG TPA: PaaI family thioesterase [Holophagaceae bacterium]|nr:PaaI family thioesterase [Holophagaceae bacterium]
MASPRIPEELAPDLAERLRARFAPWPVIEGLGLEIRSLEPGKAVILLPATPRVMNGARGTMNGGWLANLGDMACAFALSTAFDGHMPFATSDLHIRYLDPAVGPTLAEAEVIRLSKNGAVVNCQLSCGGRLVATVSGHFAIRPGLPG